MKNILPGHRPEKERSMSSETGRASNTKPAVWMCLICGWIYNEGVGDVDSGIMPGTRWEDIPEDWKCPECGATKSDFEMIQM